MPAVRWHQQSDWDQCSENIGDSKHEGKYPLYVGTNRVTRTSVLKILVIVNMRENARCTLAPTE